MDKNTQKSTNKNVDKCTQKGMNRTEFAQEYNLDTGKNKTQKNGGTQKTNQKNNG